MLAIQPGAPPQPQQNVEAPTLEEEKLCAGCETSVSSDTGGVVVAFGQSLWHVDCFKCAKCGNQVNADTNLLLLSDGSPVCANCYNCKVCKLPILDEAVMTGDDSFHAECFTCRSCKERIVELVFAKTSQGFYCMKCHNERVARSRRHIARKQRERERAAPRSSSGRPGSSGGVPQPKGTDTGNGASSRVDSERSKGPSAHPATTGEASTPPTSSSSLTQRAASPIPPSLSVTAAGSSSATDGRAEQPLIRTRANSHRNRTADGSGELSNGRPPPYSRNSGGISDGESAQSSSSFGYNGSSTQPTSPSLSISVSHEAFANEHHNAVDRNGIASATPPYMERSSSLAQREKNDPKIDHSGWPGDMDQDGRPRPSDSSQPFLQPGTSGRRREKRNSVNPGLQLEASKMMQGLNDRTGPGSLPSPVSPTESVPASTAGTFGPQLSPTKPSAHSPVKESFGDNSSGSTAFYSPSPSPQPQADPLPTPRSAPLEAMTSPSAIKRDATSYFPQRSASLQQGTERAQPSHSAPVTASRPNGLPTSPYNGKAPTPLRVQRLAEEPVDRLSPHKSDFTNDARPRSRSVSPHPPDVPRSIESGTDTETDNGNDSDDIMQSYMDRGDEDLEITPHVPPKRSSASSPTDGRFSDSQPNSAGVDGDDVYNQEDHGASVVTTRRSGFFIPPALPPMRFSMNSTDFNDLLTNIGDPRRLSIVALKDAQKNGKALGTPEKSEDVASVATPTSVASTVTPLKDAKPSSSAPLAAPSSFKPPERKASLRVKRVPPPPLGPMPGDDEKKSSSVGPSLAASPLSPRRNESHMRRPSQPEAAIRIYDELGSPRSARSSSESRRTNGHGRSDSSGALSKKQDSADLVVRRLKEALSDASERSADYVKLDKAFVEVILSSLDQKKEQVVEISTKLDKMKRSSHMMLDGLSIAHDEFKQEAAARRNAEEEVSRLKIEVSGQAARITALSSDDRRREVQKQLTKEISDNLTGLEQDLSKLKVERDMTIAEVEELSASMSSIPNGDAPAAGLGRSLTMRLDNIKRQYQHDLVPLTKQREELLREILDLKEARDIFLEETAVLNARNEELAQLNTQYDRRLEINHAREKSLPEIQWKPSLEAPQAPPMNNTASGSSAGTLVDDAPDVRTKLPRPEASEPQGKKTKGVFPWAKTKEANVHASHTDGSKIKKRVEHAFQQISVLRFARCDLCGDKMWGSQARCSSCNMSVHIRCVGQVHSSCTHDHSGSDELLAPVGPPKPSMFGRDLREQVQEDSEFSEVFVPIIVEKCIKAVETNAIEYEGIYRKSGGSGQSKAITALFERREYDKFDLTDSDLFNDISSVTSVLKNYFRMLPNPLMTFGMHEAFAAAGGIKDLQVKGQHLRELVKQLPAENYHTLHRLMHHLHRIQQHADANLMNARNLGVVFGPTLMRSADPSREFADMAGKSLAIEYLIENAPTIFPPLP